MTINRKGAIIEVMAEAVTAVILRGKVLYYSLS